jgi:hypothetical protein
LANLQRHGQRRDHASAVEHWGFERVADAQVENSSSDSKEAVDGRGISFAHVIYAMTLVRNADAVHAFPEWIQADRFLEKVSRWGEGVSGELVRGGVAMSGLEHGIPGKGGAGGEVGGLGGGADPPLFKKRLLG